jgi:hypothetical protein
MAPRRIDVFWRRQRAPTLSRIELTGFVMKFQRHTVHPWQAQVVLTVPAIRVRREESLATEFAMADRGIKIEHNGPVRTNRSA